MGVIGRCRIKKRLSVYLLFTITAVTPLLAFRLALSTFLVPFALMVMNLFQFPCSYTVHYQCCWQHCGEDSASA